MRRTKTVATIGPNSDSPEVLEAMILAGMDVARISLAHNTLEKSLENYRNVRAVAKKLDRNTGILLDLPGPKVRTATFESQGCNFEWGQKVSLRYGNEKSTCSMIEVDYEELATSMAMGDTVGFGDGGVILQVENIKGDELECVVLHQGHLVGRPGVHIPAERLKISTPTDIDLANLEVFLEEGLDLVALSFVRTADDIFRLNLEPPPKGPLVIAKIETSLAVENLSEIVEASGAVMVARGDLGVNYPLEEVPHLQKTIIQECIAKGRPVITATQMLESMIHGPTPTRAEVSDIANAVFDGSSAVMLSAETAIGTNPVKAMETMVRVAEKADEHFDSTTWSEAIAAQGLKDTDKDGNAKEKAKENITNAITMAGARVANEMDLAAIICISGSGLTVRSVARFRPGVPILGFSPDPRVIAQLSLSWGVTPFYMEESGHYEDRVAEAIKIATSNGLLSSGDLVAVLAGLQEAARVSDIIWLCKVP